MLNIEKTRRRILSTWDFLYLGVVPFLVTEGTHAPGLHPALDAVEMEDVSAGSEGDRESVFVVRGGRGLVLDGGLVEGVAADGAAVGTYVPGPHRHRIPFLDLKPRRS